MNMTARDKPVLSYLHMVAGLQPYLEEYSRPTIAEDDRTVMREMLERHENNLAYFRERENAHGDGDQAMDLVLDHVHAHIDLKCSGGAGSVTRLIFKRAYENDEWDRPRVLISAAEYRHNTHAYDVRVIIPHVLPETALSAIHEKRLGEVIVPQTGQAGPPRSLLEDGTADLSTGYLPASFNAILAFLQDWRVNRADHMGQTLLVLGHPNDCNRS